MVELPGKGVRVSQERSFAFQAGLAAGNQLCPGGPCPGLPGILGSK